MGFGRYLNCRHSLAYMPFTWNTESSSRRHIHLQALESREVKCLVNVHLVNGRTVIKILLLYYQWLYFDLLTLPFSNSMGCLSPQMHLK